MLSLLFQTDTRLVFYYIDCIVIFSMSVLMRQNLILFLLLQVRYVTLHAGESANSSFWHRHLRNFFFIEAWSQYLVKRTWLFKATSDGIEFNRSSIKTLALSRRTVFK